MTDIKDENKKESFSKWINKVITGCLIAVLSGLILLYYKYYFFDDSINKENTKSFERKEKKKVIYEKKDIESEIKIPILDNNLYISQNFNKLVIGGINSNLLKLNARKKNGESISINLEKFHNSILHKYEDLVITISGIYELPYVEIKYKDKSYVIDITAEHNYSSMETIMLKFTLSEIEKESMTLISYENINK